MAVCLGKLGRYRESLEAANNAIDAMPTFVGRHYLPYDSKGIALMYMERYSEAIPAMEKTYELSSNFPDRARPCYTLACANALFGNVQTDQAKKQKYYRVALSYLEKLKGNRQALTRVKTDPDFKGLLEDPVFGPAVNRL